MVLTARELTQEDIEIIKTVISPEQIEIVWVGEEVTTNISYDLRISDDKDIQKAITSIKDLMYQKGIMFNPWI